MTDIKDTVEKIIEDYPNLFKGQMDTPDDQQWCLVREMTDHGVDGESTSYCGKPIPCPDHPIPDIETHCLALDCPERKGGKCRHAKESTPTCCAECSSDREFSGACTDPTCFCHKECKHPFGSQFYNKEERFGGCKDCGIVMNDDELDESVCPRIFRGDDLIGAYKKGYEDGKLEQKSQIIAKLEVLMEESKHLDNYHDALTEAINLIKHE